MMKQHILFFLVTAAVLSGSGASLKEVFVDDFLIGTALGSRDVQHDYIYPMRKDARELKLVTQEFNCVTAENLMKWEYIHPEPGFYNFDQADEFVTFAETNGLTVVGHALVWHSQMPTWAFKDDAGNPVSRDVLIERMRNHIHTVVGHYKGRIKYWDVVNEAVDTRWVAKEEGCSQKKLQAFYRESPWFEIIGEEYIELAFRFAHEADPDARLLYNDYSMTDQAKVEFVADMVRNLKARDVPVHGIGMQAHWHLEYPAMEELQTAIDTLSSTGVQISITELDIGVLPLPDEDQGADVSRREELRAELNPYADSIPGEVLKEQAKKYREVFEVFCKNSDHIERVTIWGVSDRYTWKSDWPVPGRTAYPLLFDRKFYPKPALTELRSLR